MGLWRARLPSAAAEVKGVVACSLAERRSGNERAYRFEFPGGVRQRGSEILRPLASGHAT